MVTEPSGTSRPPGRRATDYDVRGRTALIWLDRPHRGNAWTGTMHTEYRQHLAAAEADEDVRVIVVTGRGSTFCVGGDSQALEGHGDRGGYDDGLRGEIATPGFGVDERWDHPFAHQFGLTKPVLAAVNGACAGVGMVLACFCDLRVTSATAKWTTAHGKLNLPAEYGLSWLLPRQIGMSPAMDLLLRSRIALGDEIAELGLALEAVDAEVVLDRTLELAEELASTISRRSLLETRRAVYADQHGDVGPSVARSLALLDEMVAEADFAEGVRALAERRLPKF